MVTLTLVALNLAVFVLEVSLGGEVDAFVRRWGLVPNDLRGSEGQGALVTLLTSTFLHAGWLHLLSNLLYLVSAVVGSLSYLVAQPTSQTPAVGASGAIAGVIAAHLVLYPGATLGSVAPVLFLSVVESTPTLLLLLLWLATQVFSSVASLTTSTGIAWWAHVGGFAAGLVLAPVLRKRRMAR